METRWKKELLHYLTHKKMKATHLGFRGNRPHGW